MKAAPLRTFIVVLLVAVMFAALAGAKPATKRKFASAYGEAKGSKLDACVTCHVGATADLNTYGEDLKAARTDFAKIEKEDSDGDGLANVEEIKALSFPGDAKDQPGAARSDSTGKAGADSTSARPDSTGGAEPDSAARKIEPEKTKDGGTGGGGKPRFPWSPGFTGYGEPGELLVTHDLR